MLEEIRRCVNEIDEIVFDAYQIPVRDRNRIRDWMSRFARPGTEWKEIEQRDEPAPASSASPLTWKVTGQVESIDPDKKTIKMWVQGFDSIEEIEIPKSLPGWALRPGVAFTATTVRKQQTTKSLQTTEWLEFRPLDFGYLSDEELVSFVSGEKSVAGDRS